MNRSTHRMAATGLALAAALVLSPTPGADASIATGAASRSDRGASGDRDAVYVLGNQVDGNTVFAYARAEDGALTPRGSFATGGTGTGAGLGSQNSVVVDEAGKYVYAVNAGSDTISSFKVVRSGLLRLSVVSSGGDTPVGIGVRDDRLYAVNAGGAGNVSGFKVQGGRLTPLEDSTAPLSATGAAPAQVSVTPDGRALVVTEKATHTIDVFRLDHRGAPSSSYTAPSSGSTPFGFDFTRSGALLVSEAGPSAASTYDLGPSGLTPISPSVGNTQAAACWIVATDDGLFAFTGNGGGSNSISSYVVDRDGALALQAGRAATTTAGVSDIALSRDSQFLYGRLGDGTVAGFTVGRDGSLTALPIVGGLPAGAVGVAAH